MASDLLDRHAGRPREFDEADVVRRAMHVFQAKGYADASMTDLLAGTGLSRGSLYKAFEDKRTLFLAALDQEAKYATYDHQTSYLTGWFHMAGVTDVHAVVIDNTFQPAADDARSRQAASATAGDLARLLAGQVGLG